MAFISHRPPSMQVQCFFTLLLLSWIGFAISQRGNRTRGLGRIVGGKNANIRDYPHQVSLQWPSGDTWNHYCGGSIISKKWIVTAAHCLHGDDTSSDRVGAAKNMWTRMKRVRGFGQVIIHENYDPESLDNDIALIRMSKKLAINRKKTDSVDLPPCADGQNLYLEAGTEVVATGWGDTSEGSGFGSVRLQEVQLGVDDRDACDDTYGGITDGMMCASGIGKDTCQGDSGGPLIIPGNSTQRAILIGITSWGIGCAHPDYPGVYTRVCKFRNWIYDKTGV